MRAPITDKHLLEMMWERFPEIMKRGAEQPAQHPKTKAIAECLAVLRPSVKGKFPHEQALEELVGYIAAQQSAQQEPVKGAALNKDGGVTLCKNGQEESIFGFAGRLFTSPPAQRTWVGLTDEERFAIADEYQSSAAAALMVEAKLKEKNNG